MIDRKKNPLVRMGSAVAASGTKLLKRGVSKILRQDSSESRTEPEVPTEIDLVLEIDELTSNLSFDTSMSMSLEMTEDIDAIFIDGSAKNEVGEVERVLSDSREFIRMVTKGSSMESISIGELINDDDNISRGSSFGEFEEIDLSSVKQQEESRQVDQRKLLRRM